MQIEPEKDKLNLEDEPKTINQNIENENIENENIENEKSSNEEMKFSDHLNELRKRLFLSVIGLVVAMIISAFFVDFLINSILLHPAMEHNLKLQNLRPFGQPMLYFKLIFLAGFALSIPWFFYQIWKFIAPGLFQNERGWVLWIVSFSVVAFMLGTFFAYFILLPSMVKFAANFGSNSIENIIDINEYISFFTTILLASGLIFELPIVTFILAKLGLVNSKFLRKYWRHSLVAILILAAVITPTPDPITQLIFAAPLVLLYEISIWIAKIVEKSKAKETEKIQE
jgi:sec-independent protein translocase protein TatC